MNQLVSDIAEQTTSHDDTTPPQSPSLARTVPSKPLQQQELSTPRLHSDTVDPDNILKAAFELSTRIKTSNVLDAEPNTTANILERLLWRRVLKARLKLMQDYLLLKEGSNTKDQSTPLDLDIGIHKHCKSPISARALSYRSGYCVV